VPSLLVGDALALRMLVDAQRAQLLKQQAQLDELNATVAGLRAQAQAAAASSARG
jgi:cell division protein FtsB